MKKLSEGIKIIFIISVLSKIMSFLSELVIANSLGTSNLADVYSMVNGAYIVIYPMISIGIWSCFLPEYKKKYIEYGKEKASSFANQVLSFFGIISIIATILFFLFSDNISRFVAPGFNNESISLLSTLLKIFSPYFIFDTVSTIYAAILQANKKFFGSQIREIVCYIPTIVFGPYLFKLFGIKGFIFALLIGAFLRLLVLLPFSKQLFKFHFTIKLFDQQFHKFLKKMPFALSISLLEQVNTLVDKIMASNLITGSVSGLNYGQKLSNAFNGFITTPIITAFYPEMAEYVAKNKFNELKKELYNIIITLALIIAPFTFVFSLYAINIVTLVFQRGSFDSTSSLLTGNVFAFYAVGIYFTGIKNIYNKLLYSLDKIKISTFFCFINVFINIILNFVFVRFFASAGLALATSISAILIFIIISIYLKHSISFDIKVLLTIFLIFVVNALIFAIPYYFFNNIFNENILFILISISIEFLIIMFVYYIFNMGNFRYIVLKMKKKLFCRNSS